MHMIEVKGSIEKKLFKLNPSNAITHLHVSLREYKNKVEILNPTKVRDIGSVNEYQQQLDEMLDTSTQLLGKKFENTQNKVDQYGALLSTLNPFDIDFDSVTCAQSVVLENIRTNASNATILLFVVFFFFFIA